MPAAVPPPRRTQAERRATTRAALLDATVACLVEDGYAHTTTRRIAERAGVTPGALQHHFAAKDDVVLAAVGHLMVRLAEELVASGPLHEPDERRRAQLMLDRLWEVHKGPLLIAMGELTVAARLNPELAARLAELHRAVMLLEDDTAAQVFPLAVARPGFGALLQTTLATLRGLATIACADPALAEQLWPATRGHLLALTFDADDVWKETP